MVSWIDRRKNIIDTLVNTLKKVKEEEIEIDDTKLLTIICTDWNCGWRTAKEYLRCARMKSGT